MPGISKSGCVKPTGLCLVKSQIPPLMHETCMRVLVHSPSSPAPLWSLPLSLQMPSQTLDVHVAISFSINIIICFPGSIRSPGIMRIWGIAGHYFPSHPQLELQWMNGLHSSLTCTTQPLLSPLRWSPLPQPRRHPLITTPLPLSVIYILTPLPFTPAPLPLLSPPLCLSCPRHLLYSHQLFNYRSIIFIITSVTVIIAPITILTSWSIPLQCKTLATFDKAPGVPIIH